MTGPMMDGLAVPRVARVEVVMTTGLAVATTRLAVVTTRLAVLRVARAEAVGLAVVTTRLAVGLAVMTTGLAAQKAARVETVMTTGRVVRRAARAVVALKIGVMTGLVVTVVQRVVRVVAEMTGAVAGLGLEKVPRVEVEALGMMTMMIGLLGGELPVVEDTE